ncbi:MAG: ABC transporter substrate-binding protein, partial [Candidatus Nanopelagicales bacterium]|nr:ABC transporter substrate-binding protein [Candidatus Nanopelagicales bacterium]
GAEAGLEAFTPMTAEELVNPNPDTILVMTEGLESVGGVDGLFSLPGLAQTEAAQTRHVVAVDDTLLLSFGARTGALLEALNSAWQQLK